MLHFPESKEKRVKSDIIMSNGHNIPSLRTLEVFEASVRHGGFTAAARNLGITQSAVSRQIADLEAILGVPLFVRNGPRLKPTATGQRLAEGLSEALTQIRAAVREAVMDKDTVVTLSMLPSVAARWFAPRLDRFIAATPQVDLRISASRHLVDFEAEGIDAAIRYGKGDWPNVVARRLGEETIRAVCSPAYADRLDLREPRDLARATLLYGDIPENWSAWFAAAGCSDPAPTGPRLGDDGAILQAALDGQGVALGRSRLVEGELATGRLITLSDIALPASFSYWFVRPKKEPSDALRIVEAWIVAEFGAGASLDGVGQ